MTVGEALAQVDELMPNAYTRQRKLDWLNQAEGLICCDVLWDEDPGLPCWGEDAADETALLVPSPWDRLYIHWLESRMDYANGEIEKYNNANAMFTAVLRGFRNYHNRTRMASGCRIGWW